MPVRPQAISEIPQMLARKPAAGDTIAAFSVPRVADSGRIRLGGGCRLPMPVTRSGSTLTNRE